MTTVRLYFSGERVGPKFERISQRDAAKVRRVALATAQSAAKEIEARGSLDIAQAPGRWGTRWTTGLHARVTRGGGQIRIGVTHDVPYFNVFQFGAIIRGKPLLWIPFSFAHDAQRTRARDYPGRLFRVNRRGGKAPILMAAQDKQPKYFGKPFVVEPKKFHIVEIVRDVARHMREIYRRQFREDSNG